MKPIFLTQYNKLIKAVKFIMTKIFLSNLFLILVNYSVCSAIGNLFCEGMMSEFDMGLETSTFHSTDANYSHNLSNGLSNGFAVPQNNGIANAALANAPQNGHSLVSRLSSLSDKTNEKKRDNQQQDPTHIEGLVESVFETMARSEDDVVGLLAYSLYKQNKRDWYTSFLRVNKRNPTDDEMQSYLIGETMARRLATYRHLAEVTLLDGLPVRLQPNSGQGSLKSLFKKYDIGRLALAGVIVLIIAAGLAKWYFGLGISDIIHEITSRFL